jgi:hypothetical protein
VLETGVNDFRMGARRNENQLPPPMDTVEVAPRVMEWWLPKGIFSALQFFD